MVTFSEVPDEISLCVNISNCPNKCPGCHSKELWEDVGELLTEEKIMALIAKNEGCTAFVISGGDIDPKEVNRVANFIKNNSTLLVCWYSGKQQLAPEIELKNFDFIKLGPYVEKFGGLNNPKTNQKFFKVINTDKTDKNNILVQDLQDITYKFWKNESYFK